MVGWKGGREDETKAKRRREGRRDKEKKGRKEGRKEVEDKRREVCRKEAGKEKMGKRARKGLRRGQER